MATASSPTFSPRILVVDDDERERGLLAELLGGEGITVVGQAGDGLEGVELARELEPDIVLMDLRMPGVGGLEATRLIKEALPFTQVIVLTAYEGPLPERSAEDVGAYAYLVKGCSTAFILEVVLKAHLFKAGMERSELPEPEDAAG